MAWVKELLVGHRALAPLVLGVLVSAAYAWWIGIYGFGYDIGFYRRFLLEPWVSFPNPPVPGLDRTVFLPRLVLDALRPLFSSSDALLIAAHVFLTGIGLASVGALARLIATARAAYIAVAVYALSPITFIAFTHFYFKQAVALPLMAATLVALERRYYPLAALCAVLVVISHQTSSIVLLLSMAAGLAIRTLAERRTPPGWVGALLVSGSLYLFLHPRVGAKLAAPPVAAFTGVPDYLLLSLPAIVLACAGAATFFRGVRHAHALLGFFMVTGTFILFSLPFHQRLLPFFHIAVSLAAAFGIWRIAGLIGSRAWSIAAVALMATVVALPTVDLLATHERTIDAATVASIEVLERVPSNGAVITSPNLLPWAHGWSTAAVFAPGILKEPHSRDEWAAYWSHQDPQFEERFIASFPTPLYFLARPFEAQYLPQHACPLHQIAPILYACVPIP